jgi:hypothetical protein
MSNQTAPAQQITEQALTTIDPETLATFIQASNHVNAHLGAIVAMMQTGEWDDTSARTALEEIHNAVTYMNQFGQFAAATATAMYESAKILIDQRDTAIMHGKIAYEAGAEEAFMVGLDDENGLADGIASQLYDAVMFDGKSLEQAVADQREVMNGALGSAMEFMQTVLADEQSQQAQVGASLANARRFYRGDGDVDTDEYTYLDLSDDTESGLVFDDEDSDE